MVIRIVTKIELTGPWTMSYPSKKFRQNLFTTFSVTDGQTDRQTDRSENITSFGGGNNQIRSNLYSAICRKRLEACVGGVFTYKYPVRLKALRSAPQSCDSEFQTEGALT